MVSSFGDFLARAAGDPILALTALLVLAVVLVNGWTDAPNAIATAVATGVLPFRRAAVLAAVCNLLGVAGMTAYNATVAETLYSIADFGGDGRAALSALCAALCAIVAWAALAWRFGIPTSESHALVAGVTGAALAMPGGWANVQGAAWGRVLLGLGLSVTLGYWAGGFCHRLLVRLRPGAGLLRRGQVAGAAAMAFLHGAQDGQKFLGVFLLGCALTDGGRAEGVFSIPGWLMLLCAGVMALGTGIGGRRIINTVGRDMVSLSPGEGFAADLGGAVCLLFCTLAGLPVSTTHAKTAALLGVGAASGGPVNRGVAGGIALTWLLTFPGCGAQGIQTAVVSNKFDGAVKGLCLTYLGERIPVAIGESPNVARKPAPDTVFRALEELGAARERAVYVGDSDVDIQTAQNAGLPCISVSWGFRDAAFLTAHGAQTIADSPAALWALLSGGKE